MGDTVGWSGGGGVEGCGKGGDGVGVMVWVCVAYLLGWAGVWLLALLYTCSPNFSKAYALATVLA